MSFVSSFLMSTIALAIAAWGTVCYARKIVSEVNVRPRVASWIAWMVASFTFLAINIAKGAWVSCYISAIGAILNLIVLYVAFREKKAEIALIDILSLILSITCVLSMVLMEPEMSAFVGVLANFSAALPTIIAVVRSPESEDGSTYRNTACAGMVFLASIFIASGFGWVAMSGALAVTFSNLIVFLLITVPRPDMQAKKRT